MSSRLSQGASLLVLTALAGCARIDYIEIEPNQVVLKRKGDEVWLRAKCMSRNGVYFPKTPVGWTSDNPKAVIVNKAGQINAAGPGHAVITARAAGKSASVDVDVQSVESVRVEPDHATLVVEAPALRPKVIPMDYQGHELRQRIIEMKASDTNVVDVDGENVWPVAPGHAVVTVRVDDKTAPIDVTVEDPKARKTHHPGKKSPKHH
jgi:hypothetical protein